MDWLSSSHSSSLAGVLRIGNRSDLLHLNRDQRELVLELKLAQIGCHLRQIGARHGAGSISNSLTQPLLLSAHFSMSPLPFLLTSDPRKCHV